LHLQSQVLPEGAPTLHRGFSSLETKWGSHPQSLAKCDRLKKSPHHNTTARHGCSQQTPDSSQDHCPARTLRTKRSAGALSTGWMTQ
jgi:hypothetical protein